MSALKFSIKPYLVRSIYQWIEDNGGVSHLLVDAEYPGVVVPKSYIDKGKITLNCSKQAVQDLTLSNQTVDFNARFGATVINIHVPMGAVLALYAKETQQGIVFEGERIGFLGEDLFSSTEEDSESSDGGSDDDGKPPGHLRMVD